MGMFKRDFDVNGESSSSKIKLWQRTSWTLSLYAVFTLVFNSKNHLIDIKIRMNTFAKIMFYIIISLLLLLFIPKSSDAFQQDNFWIFTCVKVIFLGIFIFAFSQFYNENKEIQLQNIYDRLDIETEEKKPISEWSLKNIVIRLFMYPLSLFLLYMFIFYAFPEGNFIDSILGMIVISAYLITDVMLLFRKKK